MRFFFDANFPSGLARGTYEVCLPQRKLDILICSKMYPEGTSDVDWIGKLAKETPLPYVIGGDGAILKRPAEAAALRESGLTYFILSDSFPELSIFEQASKFFRCLPDLIATAERTRVPTIYEISVNAKVEKKFLASDLRVSRTSERVKRSVSARVDDAESA